jgi:hypothetical protein
MRLITTALLLLVITNPFVPSSELPMRMTIDWDNSRPVPERFSNPYVEEGSPQTELGPYDVPAPDVQKIYPIRLGQSQK